MTSKKYCLTFSILIFFIIELLMPITTESAPSVFKVKLNGQPVMFTFPPRMEDGILLIPVREMFELFGYTVNWDSRAKTAVCTKNSTKIELKENASAARIGSTDFEIKKPSVIVDGRMFACSDIVEKCLNFTVSTNKSENTVYFNDRNITDIKTSGDNSVIISGSHIIASFTYKHNASEIAKLIENADRLFNDKNYLYAINSYGKILKSISSSVNPLEYSHVMVNMGNAYLELGCIINKEENTSKALAIFQEVLDKTTDANCHKNRTYAKMGIGNAYIFLAKVRDMEVNMKKAITSLNDALETFKKDEYPLEYAEVHKFRSFAYINLTSSKDARENALQALLSCDEAFLEYTFAKHPREFAIQKYLQGLSYSVLHACTGETIYLDNAILAYKESLNFFTLENDPGNYGYVQSYYGIALQYLIYKNPSEENYQKAIDTYNEAAKAFLLIEDMYGFAQVKERIGTVYIQMWRNYKKNNFEYVSQKAVDSLNEALKVLTADRSPLSYASLQTELGMALRMLAIDKKNEKYFDDSIKALKNSLNIYTLEKYPDSFAKSNVELGITYSSMAGKSSVKQNVDNAVDCYNNALKVYTLQNDPIMYAYTNLNISDLQIKLAEHGTDIRQNSTIAIMYAMKTTSVFTLEEFPDFFASSNEIIGKAYSFLSEFSDREVNISKSVEAYNKSLMHYNSVNTPEKYAQAQLSLAKNYINLSKISNKEDNIKSANKCLCEALLYYTEKDFPQMYNNIIDMKNKILTIQHS